MISLLRLTHESESWWWRKFSAPLEVSSVAASATAAGLLSWVATGDDSSVLWVFGRGEESIGDQTVSEMPPLRDLSELSRGAAEDKRADWPQHPPEGEVTDALLNAARSAVHRALSASFARRGSLFVVPSAVNCINRHTGFSVKVVLCGGALCLEASVQALPTAPAALEAQQKYLAESQGGSLLRSLPEPLEVSEPQRPRSQKTKESRSITPNAGRAPSPADVPPCKRARTEDQDGSSEQGGGTSEDEDWEREWWKYMPTVQREALEIEYANDQERRRVKQKAAQAVQDSALQGDLGIAASHLAKVKAPWIHPWVGGSTKGSSPLLESTSGHTEGSDNEAESAGCADYVAERGEAVLVEAERDLREDTERWASRLHSSTPRPDPSWAAWASASPRLSGSCYQPCRNSTTLAEATIVQCPHETVEPLLLHSKSKAVLRAEAALQILVEVGGNLEERHRRQLRQCIGGDKAHAGPMLGDPLLIARGDRGVVVMRAASSIQATLGEGWDLQVASLDGNGALVRSCGQGSKAVLSSDCPIMAGYEGDAAVVVTPNALGLWEKVQLGPMGGPRRVVYHMVCPGQPWLLWAARQLVREVGSMYSACSLGAHIQAKEEEFVWPVPYSQRNSDAVAAPVGSNICCDPASYAVELSKLKECLAQSSSDERDLRHVIYVVDTTEGGSGELLQVIGELLSRWGGDSKAHEVQPCVQRIDAGLVLTAAPSSALLKEIAFSIYAKVSSQSKWAASGKCRLEEPGHNQEKLPLGIPAAPQASQLAGSSLSASTGDNVVEWEAQCAWVGNLFTLCSEVAASEVAAGEETAAVCHTLHVAYRYDNTRGVLVGVWMDESGAAVRGSIIAGNVSSAVQQLWRQGEGWRGAAGPRCRIVVAQCCGSGEKSVQSHAVWEQILLGAVNTSTVDSGMLVVVERGPELIGLTAGPNATKLEPFAGVVVTIPKLSVGGEGQPSPRTVGCVVEDGDILRGTAWPTGYQVAMELMSPPGGSRDLTGPAVKDALHALAVQFTKMSWLTASPLFPHRSSTLPLHCAMVERIMAAVDPFGVTSIQPDAAKETIQKQ